MVKLDEHYVNPRLVAIYDIENPRGIDTDFYLTLAAEINATRIIDLGCGTGLLTRELATPGRQVVGVDPAAVMLAYARQQPGAEHIRWIEGDATAIDISEANLLIMTGNVSQVFLDDASWIETLKAIHGALRPGGILAFESRNPVAKGWEQWNRDTSYFEFDTPAGKMATWVEVTAVEGDIIQLEGHNVFPDGEKIIVDSRLRFRTKDDFIQTLTDAGFTVKHVYGNWHKGAFSDSSRIMVFIAERY